MAQAGRARTRAARRRHLSLTQSVVSLLNEQLVEREEEPEAVNLFNVPFQMYRAARLVGDAVRSIRAIDGPALEATKTGFAGSFILGGQIGKEPPRLFQVYAEGNFIEATDDTPYFQIGEHKYGKPILTAWRSRPCDSAEAASRSCSASISILPLQPVGRHAHRHSVVRA